MLLIKVLGIVGNLNSLPYLHVDALIGLFVCESQEALWLNDALIGEWVRFYIKHRLSFPVVLSMEIVIDHFFGVVIFEVERMTRERKKEYLHRIRKINERFRK